MISNKSRGLASIYLEVSNEVREADVREENF